MPKPDRLSGHRGTHASVQFIVSSTISTLDTADLHKFLKTHQSKGSHLLARWLHGLQWEPEMLKISVIENETRRQVILQGKLIAPWTEELQTICKRSESDRRELVIDVRELTVISQEGEVVLLALMLEGARFRGSDVFTKQILKQLARQAQQRKASQG